MHIDLSSVEKAIKKPLLIVESICEETEPRPLFCELPDDLKIRYEGTAQTHTFTSSATVISSGVGTTTTTTF